MNFKFIHAADIHLDSPLLGLERYEGAPVEQARGATRSALIKMVDMALAEEVSFILIAGDIYDGDWRDYNTGLFFVSQMAKLQEAGIKVFLVRGNHDAASRITRKLPFPDNVVDFATDKPDSYIWEEMGVAVHGQGFPTAAVTEDLSKRYPDPLPDFFNIGLLHTSAGGREGHERYAPADVRYLAAKGYDYWGLGHVHKREELCRDPWIVFSGNIQGRHIRECGSKGCTLVSVEDGRIETVEHQDLDVLRWDLCEAEVPDAVSLEEVLEQAVRSVETRLAQAGDRLLALRLVLKGSTPVHSKLIQNHSMVSNHLRAAVAGLGADNLWLEKVKIETATQIEQKKLLAYHPVSALISYIREMAADEKALASILAELDDIKRALPADFYAMGESAMADIDALRKLMPRVEGLVLSRLSDKEVFTHED